MKILYLDESGDHNLSIIDKDYPIFVLGGVILDEEYAQGPLEDKLIEFKLELFGNTDIILHTADIVRNKNGFEKLKDIGFRNFFYSRLNSLMSELEYVVLGCAIKKHEFLHQLTSKNTKLLDPYLLCVNILVQRFCLNLGSENSGAIIAEKRGHLEDTTLMFAWKNLQTKGTVNLPAKEINDRITGLELKGKLDNLPGLQLADLVVSPICRYFLGKSVKKDWEILKQKLWRAKDGIDLITIP